MIPLPLTLALYTSTKDHFGHSTYLATLSHIERQLPLPAFSVKIAHIKITPGQEQIGVIIRGELEKRGFKVIETVADWQRGTSHQVAYNQDLIKMSKEKDLYQNPHLLWLEDDSTLTCHQDSLDKVLTRMVGFIESSSDVLSARFVRKSDFDGGLPILKRESDHFFSPYFDFQPLIMRSRDFYLAAKMIETNFQAQQNVQIEMLWRLVLGEFSRSELKHMVWLPDYAETVHLGTPEYLALKESLNL